MKQQTKLLAALLLLVTAVVMVITTSFAWMTISESPVAQGIQITISGSHTVLVAPDITQTRDGQVLHYPGEFSDSLNFSELSQYDYLKNLGGLLPVSTVDGENWYIPTYYQQGDAQVKAGEAYAGQIRPTRDFTLDNMLTFANLSPEALEDTQQGSYVYLDFWVVAPVDGYKLRVSTGAEGAGSFAIDLLEPELVEIDGESHYELTKANPQASSCMRVGFLINEDTILDNSMLAYSQSAGFNSSYHRLQGVYFDPGVSALESEQTRFTIYEPNGNLHPNTVLDQEGNLIEDGQYVLTEPLAFGGIPTSVADRLTVQMANRWLVAGEGTMIGQMFRTFMVTQDLANETAFSLQNRFYTEYMQHQIYPYVTKGNFISSTKDLYAVTQSGSFASTDELSSLVQAGATDDVYMTELTGGVPQRIRMFVWLEGQDVDCINDAATGSFAVSIELAGSNAS